MKFYGLRSEVRTSANCLNNEEYIQGLGDRLWPIWKGGRSPDIRSMVLRNGSVRPKDKSEWIQVAV